MGLFDSFSHSKGGQFEFIKPFEEGTNKQKQQLEELLTKVGDNQIEIVKKELDLVNIGLAGESNVYYELKNIYDIGGYVFHDVTLKYNDNRCQFDFIIITNKFIVVVETKKLYGNIEIDSEGNFMRTFVSATNQVYRKEGMDSPVSQNEKHCNLLQKLLQENKIIRELPVLSLICCSNSKTIIKKAKAPQNIQDIVIKTDQISNKLKVWWSASDFSVSNKVLKEIVEFISSHLDDYEIDYVKKLKLQIATPKIEEHVIVDLTTNEKTITKVEVESEQDDGLYESLKEFRLNKSKEENIKAYMIFNNEQLEKLVLDRPLTIKDLKYSKILKDDEVEKYGAKIVEIIISFNKTALEEKKKLEENPVYIKLKGYRSIKSKELNLKPYFIFNNEQLEELVKALPENLEDLKALNGFGDSKCKQFGEDIIKIIKKNK